jgi:hypothetical protein
MARSKLDRERSKEWSENAAAADKICKLRELFKGSLLTGVLARDPAYPMDIYRRRAAELPDGRRIIITPKWDPEDCSTFSYQ